MSNDKTKHVLLLEDDRIMGAVLQQSLERAGLNVTLANSGQAACEHIDKPFDVVVSDYQMPKMNGREFVEVLRQSSLNSHVPVIFVTGKGLELDDEELRRELGVVEIIPKPFGPRHLIGVVQKALESGSLEFTGSSADNV